MSYALKIKRGSFISLTETVLNTKNEQLGKVIV